MTRFDEYPFYKMSLPRDRTSLVKCMLKMSRYWERLTTRNQDMSLSRLNRMTVAEIRDHAKWYTSKDAAEIWVTWD